LRNQQVLRNQSLQGEGWFILMQLFPEINLDRRCFLTTRDNPVLTERWFHCVEDCQLFKRC